MIIDAHAEGSGTIPQNLGGVPSKAVDLSGKYDLETATSSSPESSEKVETEMETGKLGINGPERPYIGGTAKTKIQLPFDHHPWQAALPSKLTAREETERCVVHAPLVRRNSPTVPFVDQVPPSASAPHFAGGV